MIRILLADDDNNLRKVVATELRYDGFYVTEADSGARAIELLTQEEYDVLLLDLRMPDYSGIEVLNKIGEMDVAVEVVVLTAYASVSTAVEAMRSGAYDYMTKPFKMDELKIIIQKAYEKKKIVSENVYLKAQIQRQTPVANMVFNSELMAEVLEHITKMAQMDFPILIFGESGVGKELAARAIHERSKRAGGIFIPINCGAIPENMLESEIFGYEKGAFTGAYGRKPGLLEMANNGTLFLDEIGDLPLQMQVKLLRVLDTKSFIRLGGLKEIKVDLNFVTATNRDLKKMVDEGSYREDLYYRLSTFTLEIPPLRKRPSDIPLLVEHFLRSNQAFKNKRFTDEALRVLSGYAWPGNVRELQSVVCRTMLLSKNDVVNERDLPYDLRSEQKQESKRLDDMEREHILKTMEEVDWHRARAAEILGIDPKTLYRKLLSYGISEKA